MTRKRWMTADGGRGRNVGRMVYQTGRLPSLFRIRMRIRLTYSCTRTGVALSILLPFSHSLPANTRIPAFVCVHSEGWRESR